MLMKGYFVCVILSLTYSKQSFLQQDQVLDFTYLVSEYEEQENFYISSDDLSVAIQELEDLEDLPEEETYQTNLEIKIENLSQMQQNLEEKNSVAVIVEDNAFYVDEEEFFANPNYFLTS